MIEKFFPEKLKQTAKDIELPESNIKKEEYDYFKATPWKLSLSPKESYHTKEKIYGEVYEKDISVFMDELNNSWYELEKNPQMQMFTALVASTFSNISPIIKKEMYTKIGEKIEKIDKIIPLLKLSSTYKDKDWYTKEAYFSKGICLNTEPKEFTNAFIENNILQVVFDDHDHSLGMDFQSPKRNFASICKNADNPDFYYGFFDFDQASFKKEDREKYKNSCREVAFKLEDYHKMYPENFENCINLSKQKIDDWKTFIFSDDGEKFIKAAYKKSDLEKFYKDNINKEIEEKKYLQKGASRDDYNLIEESYKNTISNLSLDDSELYSILKERILILEEIIEETSSNLLNNIPKKDKVF